MTAKNKIIYTAVCSMLATAATGINANETSLMEEIIITAQRRDESVQDVPIAISAFRGDALKQMGIEDTRDLGSLIPGFSYSESGLNNPVYTMRGVGFNDASRTANSTVGVYIDEALLPYPYMTKGLALDVERIEVLKGPQGTLYGRNTTGGAINYIAKKPTESFETGISTSYSRFDTKNLEGYVSGPLTENLLGRIALNTTQSSEGWQRSLTRDDKLGEKDKQAARASLEWLPAQTLRSNLSLEWWQDKSEPQAPQAYIIRSSLGLPLNPLVESQPLPRNNLYDADWDPILPWRLNDELLMVASRTYWDVAEDLEIVLIANYIDFETRNAHVPQSGLQVRNSEKTQNTDSDAFSIELRASGENENGKLRWLAGVYYTEDNVVEDQLQYFDSVSNVGNIVPGALPPVAASAMLAGEQSAESYALFANTDWALTETLDMSIGLRYTDETRDFEGCGRDNPDDLGVGTLIGTFNFVSTAVYGGGGGGQRGDCFTLSADTRTPGLVENSLNEDNVSGKVAFSWRPTEDHMFYLSYSRGYKSGSFPLLGASEASQYDPVTQEKLDAYEIGAKSSWYDGNLRGNIALFEYDYEDKQLLGSYFDPIFGVLPQLDNAPESSISGVEFDLQFSPLDGLYLSLAGSYLDTEITEYTGTTSTGITNVDFSGNEINFAPRQELTFLANYRFPINDSLDLSLGADLSYVGKTTSDLEGLPEFRIPSYSLINLRTGLHAVDDSWSLSLWGRNIGDEFYILNTPQLSADALPRYAGQPQTYGITFEYHNF